MPGGGTTFHLIRHGDYGMIGRALAGRAPGHSLSDEGRRQADRIAAALGSRPVAAVASGPLERARETAFPLGARLRLAVRVEPGFDEIDFGDWTGQPFPALHAMAGWHEFNRFRSAFPIPGGETMLAAQARAVAAMRTLIAGVGDAEIAVFSHADVIKAMLAHFLALPLDLLPRIEIDPGSRSELVVYEADVRVRGINLPAGS
jgi:probable phosphoglycerate mutase